MNKSAVIFGAGSIGRGFIGELMNLSDFDITLVDVNQELIKKLNEKKSYTLELLTNEDKVVKNIPIKTAINGNEIDNVSKAVAYADIIFTAVGQKALIYIASPIALGIEKRQNPINIILCENMMDAHIEFSDMVEEYLDDKDNISKAGFIRASVGRMVPLPKTDSDILVVKAEPYYHLPVDADFIRGELPQFVGLEKTSPFDYAIDRKLFIHNLGHVACAWLGYKKNYTYIYEAVSDIEIRTTAQNAMMEAASALCKKYDKDINDLLEHINDLLMRFENISLGDTISRVGRDTKRKLSSNDRAVGAYKLCRELNLSSDAIIQVIKSGLEFQNDDEGTMQIQHMVAKDGIDKVFEIVT